MLYFHAIQSNRRGSRDPSPQLILGAEHAGYEAAVSKASERVTTVCLHLCVSPSVLTCTLVFLGLQTRKQPVLLANGLYGKTSICKSQTIGNTLSLSGKGFTFVLAGTLFSFAGLKIINTVLEILIQGFKRQRKQTDGLHNSIFILPHKTSKRLCCHSQEC